MNGIKIQAVVPFYVKHTVHPSVYSSDLRQTKKPAVLSKISLLNFGSAKHGVFFGASLYCLFPWNLSNISVTATAKFYLMHSF